MKSAHEILAEVTETIVRMHHRPQMYIGSTGSPRAAEIYDGMMWVAHWFWATAQNRERDLGNAKSAVITSRECGNIGFAASFRERNPNANEHSVFEYVRDCWSEIDTTLGIDISIQDSAD